MSRVILCTIPTSPYFLHYKILVLSTSTAAVPDGCISIFPPLSVYSVTCPADCLIMLGTFPINKKKKIGINTCTLLHIFITSLDSAVVSLGTYEFGVSFPAALTFLGQPLQNPPSSHWCKESNG